MPDKSIWRFINFYSSNEIYHAIYQKGRVCNEVLGIKDALKRSHQCATIQLDFQMPEKFDLTYINQNN
jgi:hypothetical protein